MNSAHSPRLAKILIYPIKSLDGIEVSQATLLKGGALQGDREFALIDAAGNFINGKRDPRVHLIRSHFNLSERTVSLHLQGHEQIQTFHLDGDRSGLEAWFSRYFGFSIQLAQNRHQGFPDDTASPGPTVISTATLATVASWFPELSLEELRLRFRANLEIEGAPAFWEDQLFASAGQVKHFRIGAIQFAGVNPCQRCSVPTRHPLTAEVYSGFQKIFVTQRKASLPVWVNASRFNHFYRLSVNTKVSTSETGKVLQVSDAVRIDENNESR